MPIGYTLKTPRTCKFCIALNDCLLLEKLKSLSFCLSFFFFFFLSALICFLSASSLSHTQLFILFFFSLPSVCPLNRPVTPRCPLRDQSSSGLRDRQQLLGVVNTALRVGDDLMDRDQVLAQSERQQQHRGTD